MNSTNTTSSICKYASECSGCSQWGKDLAAQQKQKIQVFESEAKTKLQTTLPAIAIHSLGPAGLRDRLDFTLENGKFGLKSKVVFEIVDLPRCEQLSPALQNLLAEFRATLPPIKKGSVRLRVSPTGEKGIWLDFAHTDIQWLFEEKTILSRLLALAFVEVGQRRKKLIWSETESRFRLVDPELHAWTSTFVGAEQKAVGLSCYVSSFSQTGEIANRKISEIITAYVSHLKPKSIYEFGAGIGTLTFPALVAMEQTTGSLSSTYTVFESDKLSLEGLKASLAEATHKTQVQINSGDFQNEGHTKNSMQNKAPADVLLLNPPRSGVGAFLKPTLASARAVIYMSCFAESLIKDAKLLIEEGFKLKKIELVDQFPQTTHGEWLTLWEREQFVLETN